MLQRLGRSATRLAAPARAHWEALGAREYAGQPLQAEQQSSLQQEVCRHSPVVMTVAQHARVNVREDCGSALIPVSAGMLSDPSHESWCTMVDPSVRSLTRGGLRPGGA